jgi:regulatory protein
VIIEIRPKGSNRLISTVFVDEEPMADIHAKIFGKEVAFPSCETLGEFQSTFLSLEYVKAKKYALDRLAQRSYPSGQLGKLLQRNLVSIETIEKVLLDCKRMGFLNDDEWLEGFVKGELNRGAGPQMILFKLKSKGVTEKLAQEYVEQFASDKEILKSIQKLLTTKLKKFDLTDFKQRQKAKAALARKGYPFDLINERMKHKDEE